MSLVLDRRSARARRMGAGIIDCVQGVVAMVGIAASISGCIVETRGRSRPQAEATRVGCKLDVGNRTASCPCAGALDMKEMPDRSDIETLTLTPIEPLDLAELTRLHHLRRLGLDIEKPIDIRGLSRLDEVRELWITNPGLDLTPIQGMKKLEKISISCRPCKNLDVLGRLDDLMEVTIEGTVLVDPAEPSPDAPLPDPPTPDGLGGEQFGSVDAAPIFSRLRERGITVHDDRTTSELMTLCEIDTGSCPSATDMCKERTVQPQIYVVD